MKTVNLTLAAFLASGAVVYAQETQTSKFEVGLDYSWLHVNSANYAFQRAGNGGSGFVEYNINNLTGLVADFGGYAYTRRGINDKALICLFGPRFSWRHSRLSPYVQFLFGGAYAWSCPTGDSQKQNAFATAVGGGLDINLTKHLSIKPIEVEYLMTQFDSATLGGSTQGFGDHQNDVRYPAGVVFKCVER